MLSSVSAFCPCIHHLSAVLPSASVHHCPCYTIKCPCTHPSPFPSLFHSISLLHGLLCSLAIICLLTPPSCLSVCSSVSAGITFFASYLMSWWCNYSSKAFPQQNWCLGSFHSYFCFCCMFLGETKTSGFSQVAARQCFRVDILTFVERMGKRERKEESHTESSKKTSAL